MRILPPLFRFGLPAHRARAPSSSQWRRYHAAWTYSAIFRGSRRNHRISLLLLVSGTSRFPLVLRVECSSDLRPSNESFRHLTSSRIEIRYSSNRQRWIDDLAKLQEPCHLDTEAPRSP